MKNIKAVLRNIELFSSLSDEDIDKLAAISKMEHYSPGSIVFYENDSLSHIYYLAEGRVKLYKIDKFDNEIFLNDVKEDAFIYLVKKTYKHEFVCSTFYSVETLSEAQILLIDIEKFKHMFIGRYEILTGVLHETYNLLEQFQYIINRDLIYDGTAKVAHMLCNNLEDFNKMKKNDIAYRLHIQPETLSRIVKKLQKEGCIEIENRNVTILNRAALEKHYK